MKSPVALLHAILADAKMLEPDVKGTDRDSLTISKRFEDEGYGFLAVALPALGNAITMGLSTGCFACPLGFSKVKGGALPKLFSGLLCEVFELSSGLLKDNPNLGVVRLLRQLTYVFKKVRVAEARSEKLHDKAARTFLDTDLIIPSVIIEKDDEVLLRDVSRYFLNDWSMVDLSDMIPKHGPGAVSEQLTTNQKWQAVYNDLQLADPLYDDLGLETFLYSTDGHLPNVQGEDPLFHRHQVGKDIASSRIARFVSVPKSSTSNRGITVEPVTHQFVQQALNRRLRENISRCPILKQSLALTDQTKNQILAVEGSITDNYATIDLKSASDLLSVKLVKIVFGHLPEFLGKMLDCRTSLCEVNKEVHQLEKYAGMGNATTFPVQSVVFTAISIAAILQQRGHKPTFGRVKRTAREVRVYGDDVIVPSEFARQVCVWFSKVGLAVNLDKSFLKGNFKESCGVDSFRGTDVTPIYCRARPDSTAFDAKDIASLVSFSNSCWLSGLKRTGEFIKELVESRLRRRLPLVPSDSSALGWHTHQNARTIQKWNRNLHRFEFRATVVKTRERPDPLDGVPALMKCLISSPLTRNEYENNIDPGVSSVLKLLSGSSHDDQKTLEATPKRYATYVSMRWVPSL